MNRTSAAPAAPDTAQTTPAGIPTRPLYELRPLRTDADRAEAAALIEDRARWLAARGISVPAHHTAAYRDARAEAVGLYEETADGEEVLIGCLRVHRQPAPRPESTATQRPALRISLVYTAPARKDRIGWLITLWIADFAARTGAATVHCEVPSQHSGSTHPGRLLDHLRRLGWLVTGTGLSQDGERVARLQLTAQDRDGLAAMVNSTVPPQHRHPPPKQDPMTTSALHTGTATQADAAAPPDRSLVPRAADQQPLPAQHLPVPDLGTLKARRTHINRVALALPGPLHVVLYALTVPGTTPNDDLAAVRGYAETQHLVVVGQVVDWLDSVDARTGGEDPRLRRGFARVLQMISDPDCAVRCVAAASRTAITPADRLYEDLLTCFNKRRAGLWLVRSETEL
ncbi:hypothetical protein AB0F20_09860 [Streptomyces goshikiensis]|uniref:hypothetical protein n=1 Tax=Streptomyces goshikiensis TaxID=1942 RepID=UPI0033E611BC